MHPFTDCNRLGILLVEQTSLMQKISNSIEYFVQWMYLPCCVSNIQDEDINIANFEWTCHKYVWLSCYQHKWVWLNVKSYQWRSMHWFQLADHWLRPSTVQSNWWQLLPRVQSALLVWVRDHNHGLLMYIFCNLCTSVNQCDSKAWDDDKVGWTSHKTFSHGTIW